MNSKTTSRINYAADDIHKSYNSFRAPESKSLDFVGQVIATKDSVMF